ncbi:hypothetical protein MKW98_025273, partial [Papaver atlanticum]
LILPFGEIIIWCLSSDATRKCNANKMKHHSFDAIGVLLTKSQRSTEQTIEIKKLVTIWLWADSQI